MEAIIIYPENEEQLTALKAFANALKVKFEMSKSPYNPEFVRKIRKSLKQVENGKFTILDPTKSIWENLK